MNKPEGHPEKPTVLSDGGDFVDWSKARRVGLPNLKPSTKTISGATQLLPIEAKMRIQKYPGSRSVAFAIFWFTTTWVKLILRPS